MLRGVGTLAISIPTIRFALYMSMVLFIASVLHVHAFSIRHDEFSLVPGLELQGPTAVAGFEAS
jgi:hypothetical protein